MVRVFRFDWLKSGRRKIAALLALAAVLGCALATPAGAQGLAFREEEVSFESQGVRLHGTALVPEGEAPFPAIALVAGAGLGERNANRALGEEFARAGIVTLLYDKRTEGYSASPTGARSFSLLAGDAVAAVQLLQSLPYVNSGSVGLWGVSEGGWVAPLAAARSDSVAFVITLAGTGVSPSAQTGWSISEALAYHGAGAQSMHTALAERLPRFIVSSEMMAEAAYDPVPTLEQVRQPLLAVWGEKDTVEPAPQSAAIFQAALERGGNSSYTLRFIPNADHDCYRTQDGFRHTGQDFAPGCVETMTAWVLAVAGGDPPQTRVDPFPGQARPAPDTVHPAGYDLWQVQTAHMALFAAAFVGYPAAALWRRARGRRAAAPPAVRRPAHGLALLGAATWISFYVYVFNTYIALNGSERHLWNEPVVAGRTVAWLALQTGSVGVVLLGIWLAAAWLRKRGEVRRREQVRLGLLLAGAAAFLPWALHWQLLNPA